MPMRLILPRGLIILVLFSAVSLRAADVLTWHTNQDRVTADIQSVELRRVLEGIAKLTGWRVYLESNTTLNVSAKFKDLSSGDALHFLLHDLNYALVPQTNASPRLFVFRTVRANATELIHPAELAAGKNLDVKKIPNELIVRLKPGANIDDLARKLGAKVIGKIDGLNAYRLQFPDEAAASAALAQLNASPDVSGVESNYMVDAPPPVQRLDGVSVPPLNLTLNPPGDSGRVVVGLVDTAWQPQQGSDLDKFMLKTLSVAGDANPDPNTPTHARAMFEDILRGAAGASGGNSSMQVLSVDVYGPNPTTSTFDVAAGIVAAVNGTTSVGNGGGSVPLVGANVINLSLGSSADSQLLHDIIQQVTSKGVLVFASAGNTPTAQPVYPAAYPEVISVTAGVGGQLAPYANYAPYIKLELPGTTPVIFGGATFLVSGTSTSAALASGIVAGTATAKSVSISAAANALLNTPKFQFTPGK
jgi:Subtilase family